MRTIAQPGACVILLLLGLAAQVGAQPCTPADKHYDPVAYENVTVTSATPVSLTAATITSAAAAAAFITVGNDDVIFSFVGVPSATNGHLKVKTSPGEWLCGQAALLALRMIAVNTPATVKVTYFTMR